MSTALELASPESLKLFFLVRLNGSLVSVIVPVRRVVPLRLTRKALFLCITAIMCPI